MHSKNFVTLARIRALSKRDTSGTVLSRCCHVLQLPCHGVTPMCHLYEAYLSQSDTVTVTPYIKTSQLKNNVLIGFREGKRIKYGLQTGFWCHGVTLCPENFVTPARKGVQLKYTECFIVVYRSPIYHLHNVEEGKGHSLCNGVYVTEHESDITSTWAISERPRPLVVSEEPEGKRLCKHCKRQEVNNEHL